MSGLNDLLDLYAPPPAPPGLASRATAAAAAQSQPTGVFGAWRRGSGRGGWKRGAFIGSAALGLAFTSAVAAEVVSGGRIEIPVVHQVVEAIPALKPTPHLTVEKKQLAARELKHAPVAPVVAPSRPAWTAPTQPVRQRLQQRFQAMEERVQERRAAGLPTPRADRIERQANRIVERRQERGLPTPPVEQVEMRLAMREAIAARLLRQIPDDPAAITDMQVRRFGRMLPPQKRDRFTALSPEMQRQMMVRFVQRARARRAQKLEQSAPETPQLQPSEGIPRPPR